MRLLYLFHPHNIHREDVKKTYKLRTCPKTGGGRGSEFSETICILEEFSWIMDFSLKSHVLDHSDMH